MRMCRSGPIILLLLSSAFVPQMTHASGIPAFARRYRVSCNLCHTVIPKVSPFGEVFAGNGFRMSPNETPRDTVNTGDALLQLFRDVPLAMRLDAYAQAYINGSAATDLQTPYNLKILSGGTISNKLSYYLYFFFFERGEIGGIEDAFVYVNDLGGKPVDVAVGQFQVSDPMFKRELRLESQDYAIYRARIGRQPADLTYDRGIMVLAEVAGFTITGELLNGNGKGPAEPDRRLDNDPIKNVFGHVTRELTPNVRLGAMGYYGRQRGTVDPGPTVQNTLWMVGGDATISLGPIEVNAQYVHREDDAPNFVANEPKAVANGGLAELIIHPPGSRWYGVALYNLVDANLPLLDVRLGGPKDVTRYQTLTAGAGYVLRRNFRVLAEGTWDLELKEARWTLGLTTAF
ncbi:MAG: hypothetical protein GTN62_05945 [Gemmatimonadales bacterium]|nr:hypothetical protein [Gemmatimonadales bacterium]NIN11039.1 hypothetical protein [Gemmatimonadales bacterium]NIN49636.1 hypothetical protein [Gemmatimonadales bacterium]NIP07100.1 hypothetical protein [Gemmatimonadales bacterium]NIQ99491.1 hypothetical protein [Gemmatimonadales bacterium]